ncbi:MAG: dipeptidase [Sphingomonadales bacterium]
MNRRDFFKNSIAVLAMSGMGYRFLWAQSNPQSSLIIDAMGEIRPVYDRKLLQEILSSGLNAISVTLTDPKSYEQEAYDWTVKGIEDYDKYISENSDLLMKATNFDDLAKAKESGKLGIYYLVQNTTHFGRDLDRVDEFYNLGQRISQMTYNYQNWVGSGCKEKNGSGLTRFGHELVEKLNDIGMLIDLSHANMRTMADTIKASNKQVHISHTACDAVNKNKRNTTDENLRLLAGKGGVVGICQIREFITPLKENNLFEYFKHIEHAINVAGIDHVAIGSDRDHRVVELSAEYIAELKAEEGENMVMSHLPYYLEGLNGPRRMETIWDGLVKRGYSEGDVEKVMGLNLGNLYKETLA